MVRLNTMMARTTGIMTPSTILLRGCFIRYLHLPVCISLFCASFFVSQLRIAPGYTGPLAPDEGCTVLIMRKPGREFQKFSALLTKGINHW
jgi:hypothetical protein